MIMKIVLAVGCLVGGLCYFISLWRHKRPPHFIPLMEALTAGIALTGAGHLLYSAFYPEHLVHVFDKEGQPLLDVRIELGEWHFTEVFLAGVSFFAFSLLVLVRACGKQH